MDPGNANVILYDDKTLKIHDVGHFVFDRENGINRILYHKGPLKP
jgi:hypothetical protein